MLIDGDRQAGRTPVFWPAQLAVGPRRMPRIALPCPADGDRTRANQREALAGALPLEHRDQLAALPTDQGSRHRATRRKNALFAGRESGARTWAILASLINTAKLNDLDPQTYLADVLERMISGGTPVSRLDELLAWHWKAARDALAPAAA